MNRLTVLREKVRRTALPSQNINVLQRKFDALFCGEDADPTRVWRNSMIVEFISSPPKCDRQFPMLQAP
jgi:hypothetical protein